MGRGARRIAWIADDLGLSEEVNDAVFHTHRKGVLTGAALMMGQPGTRDAVERARETPSLEIGWHLHLVDSMPVTRPAWPWGASPWKAGLAVAALPSARRLVRREIERQWRLFEETGLPCRFVNAHHHLHFHPFVRKVLVDTLPGGFSGWLRWGRVETFGSGTLGRMALGALNRWILKPRRERFPMPVSTTLWGLDRTFSMDADEIARVVPTLGEGLHEFLFHPRRIAVDDRDTRCLVELADRSIGSST